MVRAPGKFPHLREDAKNLMEEPEANGIADKDVPPEDIGRRRRKLLEKREGEVRGV